MDTVLAAMVEANIVVSRVNSAKTACLGPTMEANIVVSCVDSA